MRVAMLGSDSTSRTSSRALEPAPPGSSMSRLAGGGSAGSDSIRERIISTSGASAAIDPFHSSVRVAVIRTHLARPCHESRLHADVHRMNKEARKPGKEPHGFCCCSVEFLGFLV